MPTLLEMLDAIERATDQKREIYQSIQQSAGAQIRIERDAKGMNQEELAEKMQTSVSWISKLENGRVPVSANTLKKLVRILGQQHTRDY